MGTDEDVDLAGSELLEDRRLLGLAAEARHHVDLDRERRQAGAQRLEVLEGEHRRRRQDRHLLAVHHRLERRPQRHLGLAVADVAAQQAIHRHRRLHVALDVGQSRRLIRRQLVGERGLELLLPVRVGTEGMAGDGLARRIELEQLFGHVAHGLLDPALGPFPGGAAETIQRRPAAAGVLLHQVEALDRDEQLVVAVIAQLEELVRRVADADLLQADELADAVVDVDDEIADLEIAEIREERRRQRALARRAAAVTVLFEDVGFGVEREGGVGQAHSAAERADGDQHRPGAHLAGAGRLLGADVVVGQHLDGAFGAALSFGHEHDRIAGSAAVPYFLHPVGNPAVEPLRRLGGDVARRSAGGAAVAVDVETGHGDAAGQAGYQFTGRHEEGARCRQRRRRTRPAERVVVARLGDGECPLDGGVGLIGLRHGHQPARRRGQVVEDRGLASRGDGRIGLLAHRHDEELVEGLDRSLRARVEAPDRLDQVADELDADRPDLVGGIDVEDAAAHAVLTVVVDRILTVVSRLGEQRRQRQRIDLRSGAHAERTRDQDRRRRQALQECRRRADDDSGRSGRHRQQRSRPCRADAHVRRQRPVGIGVQRWKRQHQAGQGDVADALDRAEEETDVGDGDVDGRVGGHDVEQHAVGSVVGGCGDGEGFGLRGESGQRLSS